MTKLNEFIKGNIYVFTKKAFVKNMGKAEYRKAKAWVDECNGQKVKFGFEEDSYLGDCKGFGISPEWCKCIKGSVKNV